MGIYKQLDTHLREVTSSDKEYKEYKEMVIKHFEGKLNMGQLPAKLQHTIESWEVSCYARRQ